MGLNKVIDVTGMRFGKLVAISYVVVDHKTNWLCKCDCGVEKLIDGGNLRRGKSKSCGCSQMDAARKARISHGRSGSIEYTCWQRMIGRCVDETNERYSDYGGRGIKVCVRWMQSFSAFFEDMGLRPSSEHSIDRFPDNDGDYEPGNCRWASRLEQQGNKRTNRVIEYRGERLIAAEWARRFGVDGRGIRSRLDRGLSPEEIFAQYQ